MGLPTKVIDSKDLIALVLASEANLTTCRNRFGGQLFKLVKHNCEILVVCSESSNHGRELAIEFLIRFQHLAQLYKRTHDDNIYLYRSFAIQNAGEHCHALFGERIGRRSTPTPT